jgi:hypothetical protein
VASALLFVKELQRKNTKAEIGLANPLPYAYAATPAGASRGIVSGDNRVVEGARCCTGGPGHDAATGRGAIDLNALADYALAQAPPHNSSNERICSRHCSADWCNLALVFHRD